jgi:hypothetical protein
VNEVDNSFVKIKLIDMNDYDEQRILRENVNILEKKNTDILAFVDDDGRIPDDMMLDLVQQVNDNAAEIVLILSATDTTNFDLDSYLANSPLFREGS